MKKDKVLIDLAIGDDDSTECRLSIDRKAMGLDPAKKRLCAPEIPEFQESTRFGPDDSTHAEPGNGWL